MAYDEHLAGRVRDLVHAQSGYDEKKMFGGICFLLHGHMACGVVKDDLMVRVGPEDQSDALALPHARPMDFTGKPMKSMIYVAPDGLVSDTDLEAWVRRGLAFTATLPPKKPKGV